ncbi:unnamed protein product, partial [Prorocentrum cordatum]
LSRSGSEGLEGPPPPIEVSRSWPGTQGRWPLCARAAGPGRDGGAVRGFGRGSRGAGRVDGGPCLPAGMASVGVAPFVHASPCSTPQPTYGRLSTTYAAASRAQACHGRPSAVGGEWRFRSASPGAAAGGGRCSRAAAPEARGASGEVPALAGTGSWELEREQEELKEQLKTMRSQRRNRALRGELEVERLLSELQALQQKEQHALRREGRADDLLWREEVRLEEDGATRSARLTCQPATALPDGERAPAWQRRPAGEASAGHPGAAQASTRRWPGSARGTGCGVDPTASSPQRRPPEDGRDSPDGERSIQDSPHSAVLRAETGSSKPPPAEAAVRGQSASSSVATAEATLGSSAALCRLRRQAAAAVAAEASDSADCAAGQWQLGAACGAEVFPLPAGAGQVAAGVHQAPTIMWTPSSSSRRPQQGKGSRSRGHQPCPIRPRAAALVADKETGLSPAARLRKAANTVGEAERKAAGARTALQAAHDRLEDAELRQREVQERLIELEEEARKAKTSQERLRVSDSDLEAMRGFFLQLRTLPTAHSAGNFARAWELTMQHLQAVEWMLALHGSEATCDQQSVPQQLLGSEATCGGVDFAELGRRVGSQCGCAGSPFARGHSGEPWLVNGHQIMQGQALCGTEAPFMVCTACYLHARTPTMVWKGLRDACVGAGRPPGTKKPFGKLFPPTAAIKMPLAEKLGAVDQGGDPAGPASAARSERDAVLITPPMEAVARAHGFGDLAQVRVQRMSAETPTSPRAAARICSTFARSDEHLERFFRACCGYAVGRAGSDSPQAEAAVEESTEDGVTEVQTPMNFAVVDSFTRLVYCMMKGLDKVQILTRALGAITKELQKDAAEQGSSFNQRPYYRPGL